MPIARNLSSHAKGLNKIAIWRRGYIAGIRAAADFAGTWNSQIFGTKYHFEDIILGKFNQISKRKMRRVFKPQKPKVKLTIARPYDSHDGPVGWTVRASAEIKPDTKWIEMIICECKSRRLALHAKDVIEELINRG